MRKVEVSEVVLDKLDELANYMVSEFKLSKEVVIHRIDCLLEFLNSLSICFVPFQTVEKTWLPLHSI